MDICEVRVESSVDQKLEPLLILEEGDEPLNVIDSQEREKTVLRVRVKDENTNNCTRCVEAPEERALEQNDVQLRENETESKDMNKEKNTGLEIQQEDCKQCRNITKLDGGLSDGMAQNVFLRQEKMLQDEQVTPKEVLLRPDRLSPADAKPTPHRLSSDFPEALYDLLFTLQEGRRLNDQRCSFRMERRRRCYSEPSTPRNSHKVVFSSMTSLQKEEFFDQLATSQGRRLNDQRAELQNVPPALPKPKQRKNSIWRFTEVNRGPVPTPKPPKEDLYNMIVNSQAQGRLEEQRSAAPGPMDDEDFFSLLLKVQGGRMDEQRMELKPVH